MMKRPTAGGGTAVSFTVRVPPQRAEGLVKGIPETVVGKFTGPYREIDSGRSLFLLDGKIKKPEGGGGVPARGGGRSKRCEESRALSNCQRAEVERKKGKYRVDHRLVGVMCGEQGKRGNQEKRGTRGSPLQKSGRERRRPGLGSEGPRRVQ